jgi:hypothetical protein
MGDLQLRAEAFDLAADDAMGADRIARLESGADAAEVGEGQEARAVEGPHFPRLRGDSRLLVGFDRHLEGLDLAFDGVAGLGRMAAYDAVRLEERHVAHDRTRQLFKQGRDAFADAFQRLDGRKERKQNLGPHVCLYRGWRCGRWPSISAGLHDQ